MMPGDLVRLKPGIIGPFKLWDTWNDPSLASSGFIEKNAVCLVLARVKTTPSSTRKDGLLLVDTRFGWHTSRKWVTMVPGDLVRLTPGPDIRLWKYHDHPRSNLLDQSHCGDIIAGTLCLVLARLKSTIPERSDEVLVLTGTRFGWNSMRHFKKIEG